MPDLPKKKVGIVACSGEELAEGTVTRLAALRVLEQLRPEDTVTICLPLFLAGGEGDRAFARFYPTVAVDGCELRCAARATEKYSGKPAAGIVMTNVIALPVLFEQFRQAGKRPSPETIAGLLEQVKIYNEVPAGMETAYEEMLAREYAFFCARTGVVA